MKKLILFVIGFVLLFLLGCTNSHILTTPVDEEAVQKDASTLPSWDITYEKADYTVSLECLMTEERRCQEVDPGTDMTPDEIRQWLTINMIEASFPEEWWCPIFIVFRPQMDDVNDVMIMMIVWILETYGTDVPNGPPPPSPC